MIDLELYPVAPVPTTSMIRRPQFSTTKKTSANGKDYKRANWSLPKWTFEINYDGYEFDELLPILEFFNEAMGAFQDFLYFHHIEPRVYAQQIGTGDGLTTDFQIIRNWRTFQEPINYLNPSGPFVGFGEGGFGGGGFGGLDTQIWVPGTEPPYVYLDDAITYGHYNISEVGILTFQTPPSLGQVIKVDYSHFHKVSFSEDYTDFETLEAALYRTNTIVLQGAK